MINRDRLELSDNLLFLNESDEFFIIIIIKTFFFIFGIYTFLLIYSLHYDHNSVFACLKLLFFVLLLLNFKIFN